MSSVIVKGMEMPKNCTRCDYIGLNVAIGCPVMSGTNGRATDCPLGALPDKHGRLVDADALCEDLLGRWSVAETRKEDLIKAVMADVVTPIIACQPTIVESEDE
jgi:hypothetical protein